MNIQNLAYLSRYIFILLLLYFALYLFFSAFNDLKRRMKFNIEAVKGYFLMIMPEQASVSEQVKSLALYHTTTIGRKKTADIRLFSKDVRKHHASIFRQDGTWFIRPTAEQNEVQVNGRRVQGDKKIKHEDKIKIGSVTLNFIDERLASHRAGMPYIEAVPSKLEKSLRRIWTPSISAWFIWVLFFIFGTALTVLLLPEEMLIVRTKILLYYGIIFFLFNLYYFLMPHFFKRFDRTIYLCMCYLATFGLILQTRFSFIGRTFSDRFPTVEEWVNHRFNDFRSQGIALILGLIIFPLVLLLISKTNLLEKVTMLCIFVTPLLYLATKFLGRGEQTHGAGLWIYIAGMSFQLTEYAKITYLIVLASFFKNRPPFKQQIKFAAWAAFNFALILLLPDLGSAMILLPVTVIVFVVMTSEYLKTLIILLSGSAMGMVAYLLFDHARRRIDGWLTLWTELNRNNAQIIYGLQATTRGGLLGQGLGNGSPESIPIASSDMVFSVVVEEFGLIFGIALILLFIVIWLRSAQSMLQIKDGFSSSLIFSIANYLFIEAAIVIGGSMGVIPFTGVTLPFISKGGSSLLAKILLMALLLGLCARQEKLMRRTDS